MLRKHIAVGLASLGIAGLAVPWVVQAQTPADLNVIVVRKAGQDLVGGDFTGMVQAAKAKIADVKPFESAAKALANWEPQFVKMFPPGTEHGENTRALPAIWSDRAGFEKAADKLATEATKLASIAKSGDQAGFASQVHVVGEACAACHKQFRAR